MKVFTKVDILPLKDRLDRLNSWPEVVIVIAILVMVVVTVIVMVLVIVLVLIIVLVLVIVIVLVIVLVIYHYISLSLYIYIYIYTDELQHYMLEGPTVKRADDRLIIAYPDLRTGTCCR